MSIQEQSPAYGRGGQSVVTPVTIVDFDIPFWSLVRFFVVSAFAAIPAAIIVSILFTLIAVVIVSALAALGLRPGHL